MAAADRRCDCAGVTCFGGKSSSLWGDERQARNYLTRPLFRISQPTQIVRYVAELSQHSRFPEITRGRIASLLSTETPLDCLGVFAHHLVGKTDENRNSDDQ